MPEIGPAAWREVNHSNTFGAADDRQYKFIVKKKIEPLLEFK